MADNFFNSVDNSNKFDVLKAQESASTKRSVFPYGRSKTFTANEGAIIPYDVIPIIPGDSVDLNLLVNVQSLNPFVDKMFSGMRLVLHAFYQKFEHEWEGWKNFATQGRRGNVTLSLPSYNVSNKNALAFNGYRVCYDSSGTKVPLEVDFNKTGSLSNYLTDYACIRGNNGTPTITSLYINGVSISPASIGLGDSSQVNRSYKSTNYDLQGVTQLWSNIWNPGGTPSSYTTFNAIYFSTYQRIYRDFYLNKNLCKDNKLWFPDNEDDFILPYSNSLPLYSLGREPEEYTQKYYQTVPNNVSNVATPSIPANGVVLSDYGNTTQYADSPCLGALRYRQFNGDCFTTGLPFLERGGVTQQFLTLYNVLKTSTLPFNDGENFKHINPTPSPTAATIATYLPPVSNNYPAYTNVATGDGGSRFIANSLGVFQTMNKLRELAVMTLWSEKNARTDGDYNSLIRAHYGVDPNSQDRSARYLGGTILRIQFDNIFQNSESGNTPLGTRVSIASASGSGNIGHFEFNDFGVIFILGSLIPDTFYTQGIDSWFDPSQTGIDLPYPEFTSLPRGHVILDRVFAVGGSSGQALFNYQERFLDYKYRMSRLSGHMVDFTDLKWRSMSFARYFDDVPVFNNEFVTMSPYALRSDMYTVPSEPHWIIQFADEVRLVRALPYMNKEANLVI